VPLLDHGPSEPQLNASNDADAAVKLERTDR
jgi:hypothetical protein